MNDAILVLAGILIGYGLSELRRAHRTVREILNPLRPPVTLTMYTVDPATGEHVRHDDTFILGGRVPQEPT